MRDLDAHFGDIHSAMVDREIEIVYRLSEGVMQRELDLLATVEACAELDWCASFQLLPAPFSTRYFICC